MKHSYLKMVDICKSFPGVVALDKVSLHLEEGEALGLVGENGAGKSTLIKILTGAYTRDSGEIFIKGKAVTLNNTHDAQQLGISAVYQDIMLAPKLTVGENLFLGNMPMKFKHIIDWKKVYSESQKILDSLEIDVNPRSVLASLSAVKQEMVAIAKAYREKAKVIIFDEPTALLANEEIEQLFDLIERLKKAGHAIIYISHRLEEIFRVCEKFLVLRDGKNITSGETKDVNEKDLVRFMVGRDISMMYNISRPTLGKPALEVIGLSRTGKFEGINFSVRRGEIFGIFGLIGAGRTDVARCIFGADKPTSGKILLDGNKVLIRSPSDAIEMGICLLPEQRRTQGLALQLSVRENINLPRYKLISRMGIVNRKEEKNVAEEFKEKIQIRTPSIEQRVENLSGGNQQKVVISRWVAMNSEIIIFDEPTVGVDVGAKIEIYKLFEEFTSMGLSVVVISSYLPEVIGLSDRVMVMYEGKQTGIFEREELSEELLLEAASGLL